MKVHFLGTAAAEGFPNPFCLCDACQEARILGGKNIRSRTSVILDDVLKIDFPPDLFYHAIHHHMNFASIKDLLITHSHYDHFHPDDLYNRIEEFAHGIEKPLQILGNDVVIHRLRQVLPASQTEKRFSYQRVQPFKEVNIQTGKITPLLADHDQMETCFLYFIERKGKKILYGNDTGWFPEETWNWLKDKEIDLAILDCTGGYHQNKRSRNHMCIETILKVQQVFHQEKILANNGQIITTHFSHNSGLLHEDFVKAFQSYEIQVAYDGLIIHL